MISNVTCQPNTPMMGTTRVTADVTSQISGAMMVGQPQAKLTDGNGNTAGPVPMNSTGGNGYVALITSGGLVAPMTATVTVQWQVTSVVSESAGCGC